MTWHVPLSQDSVTQHSLSQRNVVSDIGRLGGVRNMFGRFIYSAETLLFFPLLSLQFADQFAEQHFTFFFHFAERYA